MNNKCTKSEKPNFLTFLNLIISEINLFKKFESKPISASFFVNSHALRHRVFERFPPSDSLKIKFPYWLILYWISLHWKRIKKLLNDFSIHDYYWKSKETALSSLTNTLNHYWTYEQLLHVTINLDFKNKRKEIDNLKRYK